MKSQKLLKLAFIALMAGVVLHGCSKDDELMPESKPDNYSVRPDFATLDTRPPQVITQFILDGKDTEPVVLLKAGKKPTPPVDGGKKFALVVGISDYSGTSNDLTYCDNDATDWKAVLQSQGYTVTSLLDLNATAAAIDAAVTELASNALAGNEIAFCYSGHGSKGNIVTTDLYYISSSWFKTKFANATNTKMMFCFDACQIGAMASALNATGRVIAVASSTTTYSYDGDESMKNGVFTYYQMVGFDTNNYAFLEPDCKYACDQMKAWATQYRVRVAPSYTDSYTGDFDL